MVTMTSTFFCNQAGGELRQAIEIAFGIAVFENHVLAFGVAMFAHALLERFEMRFDPGRRQRAGPRGKVFPPNALTFGQLIARSNRATAK